jgi:hypothetical protein
MHLEVGIGCSIMINGRLKNPTPKPDTYGCRVRLTGKAHSDNLIHNTLNETQFSYHK